MVTLQCHERFNEVMVTIQDITFSLTLYSLPLIGLDFVLRIQWLKSLGYLMCNWRNLTLEFVWQDLHRCLKGFDDHQIEIASLKQLLKNVRTKGTMLAICV